MIRFAPFGQFLTVVSQLTHVNIKPFDSPMNKTLMSKLQVISTADCDSQLACGTKWQSSFSYPAILFFINSILVEHSEAQIRFLFTATVYVCVHYACIHPFNSGIQSTHLHTQLLNTHPHKPSMTGQSFIQLTCKVTLPFQTVASLGSLLWVPSWHATDDVRIT